MALEGSEWRWRAGSGSGAVSYTHLDVYKRQAFDRFMRADRDKDRGIKGHGLGLALVRAIAARHGAKLALPVVEKGFVLEIGWPKLLADP